jgi:hypothetical protein
VALENRGAAALTNVKAAKFRYGTLDLNAPQSASNGADAGASTQQVLLHASAAGKIVASVCQATVAELTAGVSRTLTL